MIEHEPATWKVQLVDSVVDNIEKSAVIGLVSVSNVPGPQLQSMRSKLRGQLTLKVMKNTFLEIALKKAAERKKGLDQLIQDIDGQMALLLSDYNPFKLYRLLDETKTQMPAKGGEISPIDIEINAGETSFKPGPIIGELQKAGVPAAIEGGKVIIKKDKVLVKQGEVISRPLALALAKLEIFPLTVGLELRSAYEDGTIFRSDILAIDPNQYLEKIKNAGRNALNLSVFAGIPNRLSITPMLSKAHIEAINLAVFSEYPAKGSLEIIIAKARAQMLSLASRLSPEALDDDMKKALGEQKPPEGKEPKEKKPEEEKKEKDEKKVSEEEAATGLGALFG